MNFDLFSFLLGAASAVIFWVSLNFVKKLIQIIQNRLKLITISWKERNSIGIENQILNNALDRAQRAHISGALFPLEEIVIPPLIISPPKSELNSQNLPPDSPIDNLVPHLPDFPELISQFPIYKLTISDALKNGVNCFLLGSAGSGKTTALAYLVMRIVKDREQGSLFENSIPIYAHAKDIKFIANDELSPLDNLTEITSDFLPSISKERLRDYIEQALEDKKFFLILDGMDELAPEIFDQCSNFLQSCINKYPRIQIITTTTQDYFGNLLKLRFTPYSLASWHQVEVHQFINKWNQAWVAKDLGVNQNKQSNTDNIYTLIVSWILLNHSLRTPLEWTLLIWSGFCGDLNGPSTLHGLESYIKRSTKNIIPRSILENIAYSMVINQESCLQFNQIEKIISKHSPQKISSDKLNFLDSENSTDRVVEGIKTKKERRISSRSRAVTKLIETGFFIEHQHELISFGNPLVAGYLASHFGDSYAYEYSNEDRWSGKLEMLRFLAAQNKISALTKFLLTKDKGPHHLELLMVSRWLNTPHTKQEWRSRVMEKMGRVLLSPDTTRSLRLKLITAFLISNEPTVDLLLEQLIGMQNPEIKLAAALGRSVRSKNKNTSRLINLLEDKNYEVQLAGVLALSLQENSTAELFTDEILKSGEEDHRVIVAETLSQKGEAGKTKLLELLRREDIITRRAALAGLAKILDEGSFEEIEKVLQQDTQWIIRNIAAQIIEAANSPYHALAAEPLPASSGSPWLIAYAGKLGIGISPGIPPIEALIHSVQNGEVDERIAAMDYLRTIGDPETRGLYLNLIGTEQGKLRENADLNLWYLSKSLR